MGCDCRRRGSGPGRAPPPLDRSAARGRAHRGRVRDRRRLRLPDSVRVDRRALDRVPVLDLGALETRARRARARVRAGPARPAPRGRARQRAARDDRQRVHAGSRSADRRARVLRSLFRRTTFPDVDTRDTAEQAELRRAARQLARELGPATVAGLDDATRREAAGGRGPRRGLARAARRRRDGRAARQRRGSRDRRRRARRRRWPTSRSRGRCSPPTSPRRAGVPRRTTARVVAFAADLRSRRARRPGRSRSHRCTPSTAPTSRPAAPTCW